MMQTLNLITFPGAPNLPLFIAMDEGLFEKHQLHVAHTTTPSSIFQFEQFAAGILMSEDANGQVSRGRGFNRCKVLGGLRVGLQPLPKRLPISCPRHANATAHRFRQ